MLAQSEATLQDRAERLLALLAGSARRRCDSTGHAGGGALPGQDIASRAVGVRLRRAVRRRAGRRLRAHRPAVAGRIADGLVLLDLLTVADDDLPCVAEAVRHAALP